MSARWRRAGGALITGWIGLACLASVALGSCETSGWTVIGYLAGDGDLHGVAERYQRQIMEGALAAGWNAAVQLDQTREDGSCGARRQLLRWDDGDTFASSAAVLTEETAVNMGAASTLAATVQWAREAAPAHRYVLIVLGHGNAVGDGPEGRAAVATDASAADALTPAELAAGIEAGMGGELVEVVFLDSCHGGSLETAYLLRNVAKYMCASPGRMPSPGMDWAQVLGAAGDCTAEDGRALLNRALLTAGRSVGDEAPRLTGVDLGRMDEVASALRSFVEIAAGLIAELAPAITAARSNTETWEPVAAVCEATGLFTQMSRSGEDVRVTEAAGLVACAIGACEVSGATGDVAGHGLGLFFPGAFGEIPVSYGDSDESLAAVTGWGEFIQAYGDRLRSLLDRAAGGEASREAKTAG